MSGKDEIFKIIDTMMDNCKIDYNELKSQNIDSGFFEEYQNIRIRNSLAHKYPFDIEERIENIHLALEGFELLQTIYKNITKI